MMQHSQSTGNPQSKSYQKSVQSWLMGEGWQVGEEHSDDTSWIVTASDRGGRKIIIAQPRDKTDVLVIQAGVKTDENVRRHLSGMGARERNAFYFDLQYALLQLGVEYANIGDPFELPGAMQRIYSDSLIRDRFIQRVIQVRNAQVMLLLKINSLMNEPPVAPSEPPRIGFHPPEKD